MEQLHRDTITDHHRDGGETMSEKRDGYITWDEYFMGVAKLSAMRSKDPNTQVGAWATTDFRKAVPMMNSRGIRWMRTRTTESISM